MRVRNFFTDNLAPDFFLFIGFFLCKGNFARYLEIVTNIWHIPDPAVVFFRYDQSVSWGKRIDTQKCHEILVFINDIGWDFFGDNFAEDAVFHVMILA